MKELPTGRTSPDPQPQRLPSQLTPDQKDIIKRLKQTQAPEVHIDIPPGLGKLGFADAVIDLPRIKPLPDAPVTMHRPKPRPAGGALTFDVSRFEQSFAEIFGGK